MQQRPGAHKRTCSAVSSQLPDSTTRRGLGRVVFSAVSRTGGQRSADCELTVRQAGAGRPLVAGQRLGRGQRSVEAGPRTPPPAPPARRLRCRTRGPTPGPAARAPGTMPTIRASPTTGRRRAACRRASASSTRSSSCGITQRRYSFVPMRRPVGALDRGQPAWWGCRAVGLSSAAATEPSASSTPVDPAVEPLVHGHVQGVVGSTVPAAAARRRAASAIPHRLARLSGQRRSALRRRGPGWRRRSRAGPAGRARCRRPHGPAPAAAGSSEHSSTGAVAVVDEGERRGRGGYELTHRHHVALAGEARRRAARHKAAAPAALPWQAL